MGIVRRKYNKDMMQFHKELKRPLLIVANIMPLGFTNEQFFAKFKEIYPDLWTKIKDKYDDYQERNKKRIKTDKFVFPFPYPEKYLGIQAMPIIKKTRERYVNNPPIPEVINENENRLKAKRFARLEQKDEKTKKDTELIQATAPDYIDKLIPLYFQERKEHPNNINERLRILQEVGKYNCRTSIVFLKKVHSCEKNYSLQMFAYEALMKMHAPEVHLARARGETQNMVGEPIDSPQELLNEIYDSQVEMKKEFDIFISHSSKNREDILRLMQMLNGLGKTCYIDWVNDADELKREYTCKETAEVIVNRLKQSKTMIYVYSNENAQSKWSPWELGYFYALGKPIYIYELEETKEKPQYLDLYPKLISVEDKLWLLEDGNKTLFK